jgi:hypothetical protein
VEVRVEGGAEAMNKRARAKLNIVRRTRARAPQGRAHGSHEDPQDGAGDVRVRLEEGAQPLRHAAITVEDAEMIHRMVDREERVELHLSMEAQTLLDAPSRNVMAEITDSEFPNEVIVLGGQRAAHTVRVDGSMENSVEASAGVEDA